MMCISVINDEISVNAKKSTSEVFIYTASTHALLCLPAGALGRRWGMRRMAIAGAAVVSIGLGLTPLAEFVPSTWQAAWLIAAYVLAWSGGAAYIVNYTPFLISVIEVQTRSHVFSLLSALMGIAAFVGSLVGGFLPAAFSVLFGLSQEQPAAYGAALFVAAVMFLLAVPALLQMQAAPAQTEPVTPAVSAKSPYAFITIMALVVLFRVSTEGAGKTFFKVYLDAALHAPTATIGTIVAVGQLLAIPAALLMPLMAAKWGRERTIMFALVGMALSMIPLALIPHWGAAGLGYMSLIGLAAMAQPALAVYTQESVPPAWRSTMSGAFMMASGLGLAWTAIGGGISLPGWGMLHSFGSAPCWQRSVQCYVLPTSTVLDAIHTIRRLRSDLLPLSQCFRSLTSGSGSSWVAIVSPPSRPCGVRANHWRLSLDGKQTHGNNQDSCGGMSIWGQLLEQPLGMPRLRKTSSIRSDLSSIPSPFVI